MPVRGAAVRECSMYRDLEIWCVVDHAMAKPASDL
jgi:hypothetical protein